MEWCADHGIAPSTFWGGDRGEMAPGEWVEGQDAEVIIAVLLERAERCSRCGEREDDWYAWNDEAQRRERIEPKHVEEWRCGGCALLDDHDRQRQAQGAAEVPAGLHRRLVPGPPPPDPEEPEYGPGMA